MVTKPIRFVQIMANSDHIFGLTPEGDVYYRDKPPFSSFATHTTPYYAAENKKKSEDDEKKVWKKLLMEYRYDIPKGGPEREAQSSGEAATEQPVEEVDIVIDEPARKIYKDADTVKSVQQALMDKAFYKSTYKIDGDLGKLTVEAIKAFQKSVNLRETGEIDFTLWASLGLNKENDNEVTVDLTGDEAVCYSCGSIGTHTHGCIEDTEAFIGA